VIVSTPAIAGWQVEWIENFDGSRVNKNNWTSQTQANYNGEIQCYTDDDTSAERNYEVSNGTLKIIARKKANNCAGLNGLFKSWTSGRLNSKDKREFLYGRIEARIRFDNTLGGSWPAFWMLGNRIQEQPIKGDNDNVNWPNPGAEEIDVWEWYANNSNSYITAFHNVNPAVCGVRQDYNYPGGGNDVKNWHNYAIEWTQNTVTFSVDGHVFATNNIANCPQYKEPMFVLLNVAIGGTLGGTVNPSLNKATMEVDYVAHCSATNTNDATACTDTTPLSSTTNTGTTTTSTGDASTSNTSSGGGGKFGFPFLLLMLLLKSWKMLFKRN